MYEYEYVFSTNSLLTPYHTVPYTGAFEQEQIYSYIAINSRREQSDVATAYMTISHILTLLGFNYRMLRLKSSNSTESLRIIDAQNSNFTKTVPRPSCTLSRRPRRRTGLKRC
jgi:hypothetical protein